MSRVNFPNCRYFGFREAFRSLLWPVFLAIAVATADDANPLLLPLPEKDGSAGVVMLHGGGGLSDELFEKFIALAGGKRARIVLIPSGTFVQGWVD